jgi:hypothetical protein
MCVERRPSSTPTSTSGTCRSAPPGSARASPPCYGDTRTSGERTAGRLPEGSAERHRSWARCTWRPRGSRGSRGRRAGWSGWRHARASELPSPKRGSRRRRRGRSPGRLRLPARHPPRGPARAVAPAAVVPRPRPMGDAVARAGTHRHPPRAVLRLQTPVAPWRRRRAPRSPDTLIILNHTSRRPQPEGLRDAADAISAREPNVAVKISGLGAPGQP